MRFWIVKISEPLPTDGDNIRLMRSGMLAKELAGRGHEVVWWASTFDHARKINFHPTDLVQIFGERLKIIRLHSRGYKKHISVQRVLDHREIGLKFASLAEKEPPPDLVISAVPLLELAVESVRYGRRHGLPVVVDVRDWWPDLFVYQLPEWARVFGRAAFYPFFRMAREACSGASAITGITPAFVDWGLEKAGRHRRPWDKDFPLGYSAAQPAPEKIEEGRRYWERQGLDSDKHFIVSYFGLMGKSFDLEPAIRAASILASRRPEVRFVFCGDGDRLDFYREISEGVRNVILPGWVGAAEIHSLMKISSAGLSPLPDRPDFWATINNKTIEYFSGGLPVLSSPQRGMVHRLLAERECGYSFDQSRPEGLADRIEALLTDRGLREKMAANSLQLFHERFVAEKVYSEMASHLEMIAGSWKSGSCPSAPSELTSD